MSENYSETLARLARGLIVKEINRQDVGRISGTRVKDFARATSALEGFADAVHRVVNAYGPQQILEATFRIVGEVPAFTSAGRQTWLNDRTDRLAIELALIERDEAGH